MTAQGETLGAKVQQPQALKGHEMTAQGEALGAKVQQPQALKGRDRSGRLKRWRTS